MLFGKKWQLDNIKKWRNLIVMYDSCYPCRERLYIESNLVAYNEIVQQNCIYLISLKNIDLQWTEWNEVILRIHFCVSCWWSFVGTCARVRFLTLKAILLVSLNNMNFNINTIRRIPLIQIYYRLGVLVGWLVGRSIGLWPS